MQNASYITFKQHIEEVKVNRTINRLIIHCTATPEGRDHDVEEIRRWHTRDRGWRDIGYHVLIKLDGTIQLGRPLDQVGAHVSGHNADSIGIVYVGGVAAGTFDAKDTRTPQQKDALKFVVTTLKNRWKNATIHGHREFANKACPSFDVRAESFVWNETQEESDEETFESLRHFILEDWARPKGLLKPENHQAQAMKVVEELGETFGAILKGKREEVVDGIGDILVTLIILAEQLDINPVTALAWAKEEIKDRTGKMVDGVFVKD